MSWIRIACRAQHGHIALLINDIVFAKLLGTIPQHFTGHAVWRATDRTRLYRANWLSQLLCELRLQFKLGSGCSLVGLGRLRVQQAAVRLLTLSTLRASCIFRLITCIHQQTAAVLANLKAFC